MNSNDRRYIGKLFRAIVSCEFRTRPRGAVECNYKSYDRDSIFLLVEASFVSDECGKMYMYTFLDKDGKKVYRYFLALENIKWLEMVKMVNNIK